MMTEPSPFRIERGMLFIRIEVLAPFGVEDLEPLARRIQQDADPHGVLRILFIDPQPVPSLATEAIRAAVALVELRLLPAGLVTLATVAHHDAVYGAMRQFASYGEIIGLRAAAFRDEGAAVRWLLSGRGAEPRDEEEGG